MKIIDYDTRAYLEEFVSEDTKFIRQIIKELCVKRVLEIPCANGRNLSVIQDLVDYALFADINESMVSVVKDKIKNADYKNCDAKVLDLYDLSTISDLHNIQLILIMQQSLQMLDRDKLQVVLENLYQVGARYIVLDTFDFSSSAQDIPIYLKKDIVFKSPQGSKIVRHSTYNFDKENFLVHLKHEYIFEGQKYSAQVTLQNYSRDFLISACKKAGFFVNCIYSTYDFQFNKYDGRTILLLNNDEK